MILGIDTPNSTLHVLVVDDDQAVRESLAWYLADRDFQVEAASSGSEAEAWVARQVFEIAIVDLRLPDIMGDHLIIKLRQSYPQMQFLIYTGSSNFKLTPELIQLGLTPEDLFQKPVESMAVFVNAIRRKCEA